MTSQARRATRIEEPLVALAVGALRAGLLCGLVLFAAAVVARRIAQGFPGVASAAPMAAGWSAIVSMTLAVAHLARDRPVSERRALTAALMLPLLLLAWGLPASAASSGATAVHGLGAVAAAGGAWWLLFGGQRADRAFPASLASDANGIDAAGRIDFASSAESAEMASPIGECIAEADENEVVQELRRLRGPDGRERIAGRLWADFSIGQRTAVLHVAFCPPLCTVPEAAAEIGLAANGHDLMDASIEVRVTQTLVWGARLEVKLPRPAVAAMRAPIEFAAWELEPGAG